MHPRSLTATGLACLLAIAGAAPGVGAQERGPVATGRVERLVVAMGTTLHLALTAADRATGLAASEAAVHAVELVEQRLSAWRDDSEVSRLNQAPIDTAFVLSRELRSELEAAAAWSQATAGAFDPTIGTLLVAYDLRGSGRWPSESVLAQAKYDSGFAHLTFAGDTVMRRRSVVLDTGAFGKGLALDAAAAAAHAAGAYAATFDFGGQLLITGGTTADRAPFAVADPRDRSRAVLRLEVHGGSVATTGNSEHARIVEGRCLGHILDPRTGRPADDFGSVTVWCADAASADAFSTGLFVMGPDRALSWAADHPGVEVLVLRADGGTLRARATPGLRRHLAALVPDIELP